MLDKLSNRCYTSSYQVKLVVPQLGGGMYTFKNYKTKKALKDDVAAGVEVRL